MGEIESWRHRVQKKYSENVYIQQITNTKPSASVKTTLRVFFNSSGYILTVLERFEQFEFLRVPV